MQPRHISIYASNAYSAAVIFKLVNVNRMVNYVIEKTLDEFHFKTMKRSFENDLRV